MIPLLDSHVLLWLMTDSLPRAATNTLVDEANELLVDRFSISRERQDEFAARSHNLAEAAWKAGFYDDLMVPVPGSELARDESVRPGSTAEKLAGLKPSFRPDGTITAGNASPLNDGASALLLGAERSVPGLDPLARIAGRGAQHPLHVALDRHSSPLDRRVAGE